MKKSAVQSFSDRHGTNMVIQSELVQVRKRKHKVSIEKIFVSSGCQKGKHHQCFSLKCSCGCHNKG